MKCAHCGEHIEPGREYAHGSRTICEHCCMELRMPRKRKTHWQYLTAIRSQYLQPGPNEPTTSEP